MGVITPTNPFGTPLVQISAVLRHGLIIDAVFMQENPLIAKRT